MADETIAPEAPVEVKPAEPRRKIAVVGEIPFSGSALVRALFEQGLSVRVLCPNGEAEQAARQPEKAPADPAAPVVEIVRGSLESPQAVAEAMTGVYGAALLSPVTLAGRIYRPGTHVEDVRRVVDAAQNAAVRKLVYHSALGAHLKSASATLRDAAQAETLAQACRCEDFCVRTGPLMGPRDEFLTEILAQARSPSRFMAVLGYGSTALQPLHVRDMARCCATFFLPREDDMQPGVYCLAGPETTTVLDLVDKALARVGRSKLKCHAPLFILKLLTLIYKGGAFEERVNLLFDMFCTDHNEAAKLLGAEQKLVTVTQTQEEILSSTAA